MAKQENIQMSGTVTDLLPNATFKVLLDGSEKAILAHLGGKLRLHAINVLLGDTVQLEMSPYDLTKGRIVRRTISHN